jgi:toxin ParE1/3/4
MVKLTWSPKSLLEIEEIFEYIAVDSREYAQVTIRKIIETVTTMREYPLSGRIVPEFRNDNVREKFYKSYRIIYRFQSEEMEIVTIYHNARKLTVDDL